MNCTTDNEEAECIRRCLAGDADAFEGLVLKYQRPVFNVIYRMVQNRDDASEISQAVFLKAYLKLSTFDTGRRFFSWICRIAMNDAINFLSTRHPSEPIAATLPSPGAGPGEALATKELRKQLSAAIESLSTDHRAVVVLRHYMEYSYEEIAAALQLTEKTVKSRLFEARRILREQLFAAGFGRGPSNA